MAAADDIVSRLPIDALAQQLGADPQSVQEAVQAAVPALLGGLQANAADPSGAESIMEALGQHDSGLADQLDSGDPGAALGAVDTSDGEKIAAHIFGGNQDQVVSQLGGIGGSGTDSSLFKKLIPILAPLVMSYVGKQMSAKGGGSPQAAGGGALNDILGQVLQGGGGSSSASGGLGSVVGDLLGGLLGGGRRT